MIKKLALLISKTSVFVIALLSNARIARAIEIDSLDGTPSSLGDVIPNITNTLLTAAGIIAVIMIIVGGLMYSLSAGDSKKAGTAKDTILYAVIGLVITLLAGAIVNFVLGRF
jgi:type IV secretory pathway VirB2 component (pilin)